MKLLRCLLILVLGMVASAADREMSGRVVDANTGEPIPRAHLTIRLLSAGQPGTELTMLSDADGSFHITNLPDGQVQVSCERPGYLPANQMLAAMPPGPDGKRVSSIVIRLTAQAAIEGTVTDDREMPANGASVEMVRQQVVNGRRQWQLGPGTSTDETGQFRVFGLPAGRYYVLVAGQLPYTLRAKAVAYPPVYYPNSGDLAAAQPIDLKAGDEADIEIRLPQPVPAFQVSGSVAGGPNVALRLLPQQFGGAFQRPVGTTKWDPKNSTFQISHVTPGTYLLEADVMLPGRPPVSASSVVTVGSTDVTGIRLEPGEISLDGTVRTDDASAAQVRYISVESDRYNAGAPVGADGKFHIPNLRAGTYRIVPQIFATQTCLQSVLSGGHDIRDGLTITSGVAPDAIEMTISTHCGSIDVGLPPSDNLPPNLAANLMRKAGNQLVLEKQGYPGPVSSDGTRHFLIQGVAPGDYTVYIWPGDASIEYANPEYMRQLDSYGQNVTVTADSSTPVTIDKPLLTIPKN